jgi:hypothetical protein
LKKKQHGGSRAGAGKKPGTLWKSTLDKAAAHAQYRQEVLARMAPIVQAQVEAAAGTFAHVAVVELTEKGLRLRRVTSESELTGLIAAGAYRVSLADPDLAMSRYVTDQVVGRATESLEVSGPGGGPIPTRVVHEYHQGT